MWSLRCDKENSVFVFPLGKSSREFHVGRKAELDCVVGEPSVSRVHSQITILDGFLHVQDMQSRFGTFVNDTKLGVGESVRLKEKDLVRFGALLVYEVQKISLSVMVCPRDPDWEEKVESWGVDVIRDPSLCTHVVVPERPVVQPRLLVAMMKGKWVVQRNWLLVLVGRQSPSEAIPREQDHLPLPQPPDDDDDDNDDDNDGEDTNKKKRAKKSGSSSQSSDMWLPSLSRCNMMRGWTVVGATPSVCTALGTVVEAAGGKMRTKRNDDDGDDDGEYGDGQWVGVKGLKGEGPNEYIGTEKMARCVLVEEWPPKGWKQQKQQKQKKQKKEEEGEEEKERDRDVGKKRNATIVLEEMHDNNRVVVKREKRDIPTMVAPQQNKVKDNNNPRNQKCFVKQSIKMPTLIFTKKDMHIHKGE